MTQESLDLPGGQATLFHQPPLGYDLDDLFKALYQTIPWEQRSIVMYGKEIPQPRLVAWYGDHGYMYSGLRLEARPMTFILQDLKNMMSYLANAEFNGVLLNLYKDGQSSIGMHADDEPEFGLNPVIASLSLGAKRRFDFQRKDKSLPVVKTTLTNGSVLIMSGETQANWKHGVAKTKDPVGPRINLTFRNIVNPQ